MVLVKHDANWKKALRGAADSLAIVTSFSLSTVPAPEEVVNFNYEVRDVLKSVDQAVSAFAHLQSFISNATTVDRRTSFSLQTHYGPDRATGEIIKTFLIQGTFLGSLAEYKSSIEPEMLRGIPAPTASDVQAKDWIASLTALSPDGRLTGEALYLAFFANSVTIDDPGMNEAALRSYFTYMLEGPPSPGVAYQSNMELWGGADTQINLPAKDTKFAAFPHRNIFWTAHNLAQAAPNTTFPAEGIAWLNGLRQAILKDLDVPSAGYLNLLDTSLTRDEAHALYYGDEVLGRLKGIKAQYDKKDVFWNPQSI
jgi:FAD/FMN-containing dehydrogenase